VNFTLGIDIGQTSDFTAVVGAERLLMMEPNNDNVVTTYQPIAVFHIGLLYRWPLNTPYFQIVKDVHEILYDSGHPEAHVAIDASGVGQEVAKLFWEAKRANKLGDCWPSNYKITGGSGADLHRGGYAMVGKIELVGIMQRYQQAGLLHISPHLELAPVLKAEMKNFRATISPSGHESMAARVGTHDDLLQALSLAMHHSLHYHRGDPCRQIPYQEFAPAPSTGTAPKVFGLDPELGPAEEPPVEPVDPLAVFGQSSERLGLE
jgi:hypothetical protein